MLKDQVKKKLCIVCTGPAVDDCEVVVLDLESDLKDLSEQVADSDPLVLNPVAKLDLDLLNIRTFCALGSKLYMFDDGYLGVDDSFSIMTTDDRKSTCAYDFSSSSSSVVVVKLSRKNVCKMSDMWGPKACTRACAPTPDGNIIVVYSSRIQYDPCVKRIDFEVYDAEHDKWSKLPDLAEKVAEKYGQLESSHTFEVQALNFTSNSVFYVLVSGCWFSFDLDEGVWRLHDQYVLEKARFGEFGVYYGEEPCILFGKGMCMSPTAVFDCLCQKSFLLPDFSFEDSSVSLSSAHITLLGESGGEEYKFARVYMGLSEQTKLPRIVVDVLVINMKTYRVEKRLGFRFVKSSEFVLGNRERVMGFGGYGVFPIIAGIDMSSTRDPLRTLFRGPTA